MPSRRRLLGAAAAGLCGALAGCVDPTGVLQMDEATTAAILDPVSTRVDPSDADRRDLLTETIETGSATVSGERPPLGVERPVVYDGRVYELERSVRDTRTRTDYRLVLEFDPGATEGAERSLADLPSVDVERIESLLADRSSGDDAVGADLSYAEAEREASALVPEPEFDVLVVDGERMGVRVDPIETTVTTYEYALVDEFGSATAYADELEAAYRFELTGLSGDEADVVDEAVAEGGYYASTTDDEAFEGVARTFFEHEPLASTGDEAHWIVAYEGTTYVAMIDPVRYESLREDVPGAS